jgi:hypothetical protein
MAFSASSPANEPGTIDLSGPRYVCMSDGVGRRIKPTFYLPNQLEEGDTVRELYSVTGLQVACHCLRQT